MEDPSLYLSRPGRTARSLHQAAGVSTVALESAAEVAEGAVVAEATSPRWRATVSSMMPRSMSLSTMEVFLAPWNPTGVLSDCFTRRLLPTGQKQFSTCLRTHAKLSRLLTLWSKGPQRPASSAPPSPRNFHACSICNLPFKVRRRDPPRYPTEPPVVIL